jgi:hypothetical protein
MAHICFGFFWWCKSDWNREAIYFSIASIQKIVEKALKNGAEPVLRLQQR